MTRTRFPSIDGPRLSDAVAAGRLLWVFCRWCGHGTKKNPRELFWKAKSDLYVRDMAKRMRCERCGNREAVIFRAVHRVPGR
jgi:hypothetical protein